MDRSTVDWPWIDQTWIGHGSINRGLAMDRSNVDWPWIDQPWIKKKRGLAMDRSIMDQLFSKLT